MSVIVRMTHPSSMLFITEFFYIIPQRLIFGVDVVTVYSICHLHSFEHNRVSQYQKKKTRCP